MWAKWLASVSFAFTALTLAGCQAPKPAAEPPAAAAQPLPLPPSPPSPPRAFAAAWSFAGEPACTATAAHPAMSLQVDVDSEQATFTLHEVAGYPFPAAASTTITFTGTSGSWSVNGRNAGQRRIVAAEPTRAEQASRILFLLNGGTIQVGRAADGVPALKVPAAGPDGQAWFACVRQALRA
jgi:hypothetical protein